MAELVGGAALVTGGSRGIGRAVAVELARRGADVVVGFAQREEAAREVCGEVEALGRRARAVRANVGQPRGVAALADAAASFFDGRLDVCVHCAAIGAFKPTLAVRLNQFDLSMHVNARSLLDLAQQLAPLMRGRDASLLALTSQGARRVLESYGAVGVSKAALEALVRYLAVELGPQGIRVNALSPGLVDTDAIRAFPNWQARAAEVARRTPLGGVATPTDVARAAAMLCGPDAAWITGQVIVADGGHAL